MLRPRTAGGVRVALLGTRGVPARYGGFETAVEEVGRRLVDMGHEVTVYSRRGAGRTPAPRMHQGMFLVHLPAVRHKVLETLSHSILSAVHAVLRNRYDAVVVFNAANAPVLPLLRLRRIPTAVHVDGLEWRRAKWSGLGKSFYRVSESLSVRWADALIADSAGIAAYYEDEFAAPTTFLAYGAPDLGDLRTDRLGELGLNPGRYHLVVARLEPENHVDLMIQGYLDSGSELPLVVVGSNPYPNEHTKRLQRMAEASPTVKMIGGVWDQELLDQLYAGSLTYMHGHSVGGTNPSLLRAMGAGAYVVAHDNVFNRDMLGGPRSPGSSLVADAQGVARALQMVESDPEAARQEAVALRAQAVYRYDWDRVTEGYARLCQALVSGFSTRGRRSGRRAASSGWTDTQEPPTQIANEYASDEKG